MSTYINRIIRAARAVDAAAGIDDPAAYHAAVKAHKDLTADAVAAGVDRDLISWAGEIHGQRPARDQATRDLADAVTATHTNPPPAPTPAPRGASRRWDREAETEKDTRFFDLREAGYAGCIDQDGYAVTEITGPHDHPVRLSAEQIDAAITATHSTDDAGDGDGGDDEALAREYARQAAEQADTSIEPWLAALERAENSDGVFTLDCTHSGHHTDDTDSDGA